MELLGTILLQDGVITEDQLYLALAEQKQKGGLLGMVLIDMQYITEHDLIKALAKQTEN